MGNSFRITLDYKHINIAEDILKKEGFVIEPVSFYSKARICIENEIKLGSSLLNFFGHIYIQDLSSMLPPLILSPKKGSVVLDLCASPGGKTAILSELIGDEGLIVANEPNKKRYMTLKRNLERLNIFNVCLTSYRGEEFPEEMNFSYILLDVPCSGWGTANKNPRVMDIWHGDKIVPLIKLQRELLKKAYSLLGPGGRLVYSTCTTNVEENENQIKWAIKELGFRLIPLSRIEGFEYFSEKLPGALSIKGHKLGSQGFFVACLERDATKNLKMEVVNKDCMKDYNLLDQAIIKKGFQLAGLKFTNFSNGFFYLKKDKVFFKRILEGAKIKTQGLFLGKVKSSNFFPKIGLWRFFDENGENKIVISDISQIKGLISGKSLPYSGKVKYVQLFYKDLPLTLLKVQGGRCLISK